jgi:hypothetical protein
LRQASIIVVPETTTTTTTIELLFVLKDFKELCLIFYDEARPNLNFQTYLCYQRKVARKKQFYLIALLHLNVDYLLKIRTWSVKPTSKLKGKPR